MFINMNVPSFMVTAEGLSFEAISEIKHFWEASDFAYIENAADNFPALFKEVGLTDFILSLTEISMPPISFQGQEYWHWSYDKGIISLTAFNRVLVTSDVIAQLSQQLAEGREVLEL